MSIGRGTRAMQLLAVRLIERRNPDDAIVLGDAMNERGLDGLVTGRSRPVIFHATSLMSPDLPPPSTTFRQPAYEVIYNVDRFAIDPTPERWSRIWTHWVTPTRGTYRALVRHDLLSRSVPFHTLSWEMFFPWRDDDVLLGYTLVEVRIPKYRKRVQRLPLLRILRRISDNPRTDGQHFSDAYQLPLL